MSVDFPRAWQITKATPPNQHHEECSFRTCGMLCDCSVLMNHPEILDTPLHGIDGKPISSEAH